MALLKLGVQGEAVRLLQADLNSCPTSLPRLKVDAIFGPKTHSRVVEFQRLNKITADGIAGPVTLAYLAARKPMQVSAGEMKEILNLWNKTAASRLD